MTGVVAFKQTTAHVKAEAVSSERRPRTHGAIRGTWIRRGDDDAQRPNDDRRRPDITVLRTPKDVLPQHPRMGLLREGAEQSGRNCPRPGALLLGRVVIPHSKCYAHLRKTHHNVPHRILCRGFIPEHGRPNRVGQLPLTETALVPPMVVPQPSFAAASLGRATSNVEHRRLGRPFVAQYATLLELPDFLRRFIRRIKS